MLIQIEKEEEKIHRIGMSFSSPNRNKTTEEKFLLSFSLLFSVVAFLLKHKMKIRKRKKEKIASMEWRKLSKNTFYIHPFTTPDWGVEWGAHLMYFHIQLAKWHTHHKNVVAHNPHSTWTQHTESPERSTTTAENAFFCLAFLLCIIIYRTSIRTFSNIFFIVLPSLFSQLHVERNFSTKGESSFPSVRLYECVCVYSESAWNVNSNGKRESSYVSRIWMVWVS